LTTEVSQFPPGNFSQHHAVNAALQMPGKVLVLVFVVGIMVLPNLLAYISTVVSPIREVC